VLCVSEGLGDFYTSLSVGIRSKVLGLGMWLGYGDTKCKGF